MDAHLESSPGNGKLIVMILAVFLAQVAILFWVKPAKQVSRTGPQLSMSLGVDVPREVITLFDPSVFGLPHAEGFSGSAWMPSYVPPDRTNDWSEAPRWLPISFQPFSMVVADIRGQAGSQPRGTVERHVPTPDVPGTVKADILPQASSVSLTASSPGLNPEIKMDLPSWPATDLLSSSVVQAVVDAQGKVLSTVLLSSSGLKAADEFALNAVSTNAFIKAPVLQGSVPELPLHWLQLSFDWHAVPAQEAAQPGAK